MAAMDQDRKHLAAANHRLAIFLCRKYVNPCDPHFSDLLQGGYLGLCIAAERYDPDLGPFGSYAARWILALISRHRLRLAAWPEVSLDEPTLDEEHTGVDLLEDPGPPPDELAGEDETRDRVREALALLPEKERVVIELHYGFRGREYTLQEIGERFGLTRQGVHVRLKKALLRLRELLTVPT